MLGADRFSTPRISRWSTSSNPDRVVILQDDKILNIHAPMTACEILPLRKCVISTALVDSSRWSDIRRMCWALGAFTTVELADPDATHVLVPDSDSDFQGDVLPLVLSLDWLKQCFDNETFVDEAQFVRPDVVKFATAVPYVPLVRERSRSSLAPALSYRPSEDSAVVVSTKKPISASIMHRRSDASSMPLRPDGIFKGMRFSLFGWSDPRMEAGISNQITSNGGTIVEFTSDDQFACICVDGTRPTRHEHVTLLSQRWVNDCLAHEDLIDSSSKCSYTPSLSQLPLLMTQKLCVYISEKDSGKFEEISELAKLCGIRCVSRNDPRAPLSGVSHFVFYDLLSLNRRKDLIPIAKKAGKLSVSFDWLKDTYLIGSVQDETKYDLSNHPQFPALPSPGDVDPTQTDTHAILQGITLVIDARDESSSAAASGMGAAIVPSEGHVCSATGALRIANRVTCGCETLLPTWVNECKTQRRLVGKRSYVAIREQDVVDESMLASDSPPSVKWEKTKSLPK